MTTTYQVGDIVVRTEGSWRGVNEGDVHTVKSVHGGNIHLVGFDDITFDGDNFMKQETPQVAVPGSGSQRIEVGSLVRMVSYEPKYGLGYVSKGDEGTVTSLDGEGGYHVRFPRQASWHSGPNDCELVNVIPTPTISIDEAVEACKTARSEIAELEAKVKELKDSIKGFEQVLHKAGLKFI